MVTLSPQVLLQHVANHNSGVVVVTVSGQVGCVMVITIVGIILMNKTVVCVDVSSLVLVDNVLL